MTDAHWTQILSALLMPTVAVFGLIITYRQWRISQNNLKHDLFEKRFVVYDAARNLISSISTSGKAKEEELHKFIAGTREAKWLLNEDIAIYLDGELWYKAVDLHSLEEELNGVPAGAERTANVQKQVEIKKWLFEQFKVLDKKFTPFLKLEH